jgi:acyl-coenzyme A synthetase/AMP-(fatty) acid ligase
MYGPAEATVVCIGQEYNSGSVFTRDCVALGRVFAGMHAAILGDGGDFAPVGTQGELILSGPQLALGYVDDPLQTAVRFVTIVGKRWYKTGDLARCDENGIFHYFGRLDNQVKILGYRVELEEIEHHLRDSTGCSVVAAVAWPQHGGSASGIVGFVAHYAGSAEEVKTALQQRLPSYMVPTKVHVLGDLPMNNHGKVDRRELVRMLDHGIIV